MPTPEETPIVLTEQTEQAEQAEMPAADYATVIVFDDEPDSGHFKVIRVDDEELLAQLEDFFPGYATRGSNNRAGEWENGYYVDFHLADEAGGEGRTVRVTVSFNGNGAFWTTDRGGDFRTNGAFEPFVRSLLEDQE